MRYIYLLMLALILSSCDNKQILVERKPCVITYVKCFYPGEISVMQLEPEWHATTDCGTKHTFYHPVDKNDTVWIEKWARIP